MRRQFLVCRAKIIFLVLQVILVRRQRLLAVLLSLMNPTVSGVLSVNGRFLSFFFLSFFFPFFFFKGVLTVQGCRIVKMPYCSKGKGKVALGYGFAHVFRRQNVSGGYGIDQTRPGEGV